MHRLLQRQIKRHLGSLETLPDNLQQFIEAIDQAYVQADEDLRRVERSLEMSSQELLTANSSLQNLLQSVENQVTERTAQLQTANQDLEKTLQDLQQTQTQLIQTEKMSSLGQLVAGVAHEINNPVSFIHGNLVYAERYARSLIDMLDRYQKAYPEPQSDIQSALEDLELDFLKADLDKLLRSMTQGTERIRNIVLSLRNFSRMDEADKKPVNLHEGLDSTLLLLDHRLNLKVANSTIQVKLHYNTLPLVDCYAGQINQVFMHLLNNAIDALLCTQKFDNGSSDAPHASSHPVPADSTDLIQEDLIQEDLTQLPQDIPTIWLATELQTDKIQIRIVDNGIGIAEQNFPKLFNPFFTTKPIGSGVGLSLSICYQIITQHEGELSCHTIEDVGTEFRIILPVGEY
jgi:two-component system, NtrC family, sensor kinase